jgi:hypothetical protein
VSAIYTARKYIKHYNMGDEEISTNIQEFQLADVYSSAEVKACAKGMNQLAILI